MILDEISKMLKVYRTDKKTERGQTNNQKSLLELTAQVELKIKLEKTKFKWSLIMLDMTTNILRKKSKAYAYEIVM